MPGAATINSSSEGHEDWPARGESLGGSRTVFINGEGAHCVGHGWEEHCNNDDPPECHTGKTSEGSSSVFVNGKPLARIGDAIDCGDIIATGSSNVIVG